MERNCKERLKLSWEEFMSKYEQSSAKKKKMLYDKICPAVFHCVALLRHWERNRGPSDDEAYIPDDGGGGVAGGDDDETYVPDASDEDDDWAYNLSAEDVSDLEVDEVREALKERGLDLAGDDALVRARLVQAIGREEDDDWAYNLSAEEVSDLEVAEVREALKERGLDVEGDDALVRARLVQAIEREEKEKEREREAARDTDLWNAWPWPAWPFAANLKIVFDHYASDGVLDVQGFNAFLRDSRLLPLILHGWARSPPFDGARARSPRDTHFKIIKKAFNYFSVSRKRRQFGNFCEFLRDQVPSAIDNLFLLPDAQMPRFSAESSEEESEEEKEDQLSADSNEDMPASPLLTAIYQLLSGSIAAASAGP